MSVFALALGTSCVSDELQYEPANPEYSEESASGSGVLAFSSQEELANTIAELKESDSFETLSTRAKGSDFVSLREYLTMLGLRQFTDAELAEIEAEGLIYEPEDEHIMDPYFMAMLNKDREIQVGEKIYRYVDEGVILYDASYVGRFDELALVEPDATGLVHGQQIRLSSNADFVKIDYILTNSEDNHSTRAFWDNLNNTPYNTDGSITLENGVKIPKDKIKTVAYEKGAGDASSFQKWLSGLSGINVTVENEFDSKHRMKARMYSQDYIAFQSVGMTVRMQHKRLGIWWRRKAQEFRYGWTAMELVYEFKKFPFLEPPKMPDGTPTQSMYPTLMPYFPTSYPAPFQNKNVVLFRVAEYDFTTGDVNKVYDKGIKSLTNIIKRWFTQPNAQSYKSSPIGIYGTKEKDRTVHVVIPQGEDKATDDGREAVDWDRAGLAGRISVSYDCHDGTVSWGMKDLGENKKTTINRGKIYAAVKYGDVWRACVIETK